MLPLPAELVPAGEVGLVGGRAGGPIIGSSLSDANGSEPSMTESKINKIVSRVRK